MPGPEEWKTTYLLELWVNQNEKEDFCVSARFRLFRSIDK